MADQPKKVAVRALADGTSVNVENGRHYWRTRGDVFEVWESGFSARWMEKIAGSVPPEPLPEPPQTTLPANMQPRPVR